MDTELLRLKTNKLWNTIVNQCEDDYEVLLICADLHATAIAFKHSNHQHSAAVPEKQEEKKAVMK